MNALAISAPTMTSLDLFEIINAERAAFKETTVRRNDFHARVRDELDGEHYESFVVDNGNSTETHAYRLTISQCMYVAMRESKGVRRTVQRRLESIPSQAPVLAIPDFTNPVIAARAWADAKEAEQVALVQLEQAKPAIEFVSRFVEAKSSKALSDVAKLLGWKPQSFIAQLASDDVIFKRSGSWLPFQYHVDLGRFTLKTGEASGHAYCQTRVTPNGIAWLAKRYEAPPITATAKHTEKAV